jgi:hypothetical protein
LFDIKKNENNKTDIINNPVKLKQDKLKKLFRLNDIFELIIRPLKRYTKTKNNIKTAENDKKEYIYLLTGIFRNIFNLFIPICFILIKIRIEI